MKSAVKHVGLSFLTSAPVYAGLRARALKDNPLTVLCYHTLRPDHERLDAWLALGMGEFRSQVAMLRKSYDIVSLDVGLTPVLPSGRPRAVLTFDDGEVGLYEHLLPFVTAEKLPVTVFVATGQIETGQPYWFDRVMNALQGSGITRIDMADHGLPIWEVGPARGKARWQAIGNILEALKHVPTIDRDLLADRVIAQAETGAPGFTPLAPMSVAQLKELAASPHVSIGAHSHGHELLDQMPLVKARASIERSCSLLEEWTQAPIRHFAYPNGNYTPELMAMVADLGFTSASILADRLVASGTDPFALPRIGIGRYDGLRRFRLRLVGI